MKKLVILFSCFLVINAFAQSKTLFAEPYLQIGSKVENNFLDILWQTPIEEAKWEIIVKLSGGLEKNIQC